MGGQPCTSPGVFRAAGLVRDLEIYPDSSPRRSLRSPTASCGVRERVADMVDTSLVVRGAHFKKISTDCAIMDQINTVLKRDLAKCEDVRLALRNNFDLAKAEKEAAEKKGEILRAVLQASQAGLNAESISSNYFQGQVVQQQSQLAEAELKVEKMTRLVDNIEARLDAEVLTIDSLKVEVVKSNALLVKAKAATAKANERLGCISTDLTAKLVHAQTRACVAEVVAKEAQQKTQQLRQLQEEQQQEAEEQQYDANLGVAGILPLILQPLVVLDEQTEGHSDKTELLCQSLMSTARAHTKAAQAAAAAATAAAVGAEGEVAALVEHMRSEVAVHSANVREAHVTALRYQQGLSASIAAQSALPVGPPKPHTDSIAHFAESPTFADFEALMCVHTQVAGGYVKIRAGSATDYVFIANTAEPPEYSSVQVVTAFNNAYKIWLITDNPRYKDLPPHTVLLRMSRDVLIKTLTEGAPYYLARSAGGGRRKGDSVVNTKNYRLLQSAIAFFFKLLVPVEAPIPQVADA